MYIERIDPQAYADQNTVLLTSFKRDGTPVGTPVHIAVDGDRVFFRSYEKAWKTKRIRHNPRIEIVSSTIRGTPSGPTVHARARILEGAEARTAARAIARKYPILHRWLIPWAHRLMGTRTVHFEVESVGQSLDRGGKMEPEIVADGAVVRAEPPGVSST